MKYYAICRKLLEDDEFEKLISDLVKKISKKFTEEISLETLVKILEINVSTILIIAIIDIVKVEKEKIIVPETEKFLVEKDFETMEKEYQKYIQIIRKKINGHLDLD